MGLNGMKQSLALVAALVTFGCGGGEGDPSADAGTTGAGGSGGSAGSSGGATSGGATGTGGSAGATGSGGTTGAGGATASGGGGGSAGGGNPSSEPFSFFVTSLKALQQLSGSQDGFGGDLRYGETGPGAGLRGADKICTEIAEMSMAGNGKVWRAFLSATAGEDGEPVHAIDRVGEGPWYDRLGRLVANTREDLQNTRPAGAHSDIVDDLPNEDGVPNHQPDPTEGEVDNHDMLTGSDEIGELFSTDSGFTCDDWTSAVGETGTPRVGHSWPRSGGPGGGFPGGGGFSGESWTSALNESGCAPGVWLVEAGPPGGNGTLSVGDGGGYGGFYCFALTP